MRSGSALQARRSLGIEPLHFVDANHLADRTGRAIGMGAAGGADEHAHLQAPVAEMDVRRHADPLRGEDPRQGLSDHQRAQMPDMQGLRDIGAAEVEQHRRGMALQNAERRRGGLGLRMSRDEIIRQAKVEEAGAGDLDAGEFGIGLQESGDRRRQLARVALRRLAECHGGITLKVAEFGFAGGHAADALGRQIGFRKGAPEQVVDPAHHGIHHYPTPARPDVVDRVLRAGPGGIK